MDIESLLRRASAAPLGPLSLAYVAAGPDAWTLSVDLAGQEASVRVERESKTDGLVLARRVSRHIGTVGPPVGGSRPWVMESLASAEGVLEIRLWLHGDGLSAAMLINALAELVAIKPEAASEARSDSGVDTAAELARVEIPVEATSRPEPVPVLPPKAISWQSFGFGSVPSSPTSQTAAAPMTPATEEAEEDETAEEPPVAADQPASAVGSEGAATPAMSAPPIDAIDPTLERPKPSGKAGYCRECGSPHAVDHTFCTNCGARID